MIFRIRHKTLGGHVHFQIWAGKTLQSLGLTNNNGGYNIMRIDEFEAFRAVMEYGSKENYGDIYETIVLFSDATPVEPDPA